MTRIFAELARDPNLIAGVHRCCDEWCEMCPVTDRCLAFRCTAAYRRETGRRPDEPTFRSGREAATFAAWLAAAEAEGMVAWGTADVEGAIGFRTSDPLASAALQYGLAVGMALVLSSDELRRMRISGSPSAEEVVLWHHLRLYMTIVRALAADEGAGRRRDAARANGLAKCALVSVARSRKALVQLKRSLGAGAMAPLIALLDAVERNLDARFPAARAWIRVGLDSPSEVPHAPGAGATAARVGAAPPRHPGFESHADDISAHRDDERAATDVQFGERFRPRGPR